MFDCLIIVVAFSNGGPTKNMAKRSEFVKAIFGHESPRFRPTPIRPRKFGPMEANPWRQKNPKFLLTPGKRRPGSAPFIWQERRRMGAGVNVRFTPKSCRGNR
jgi:hypothetical protein